MTTYASPRLTRRALQILVTLIFLAGCYMLVVSVVDSINEVSASSRHQTPQPPTNQSTEQSVNITTSTFSVGPARFPSTSSISVKWIVSLITVSHGVFGIVAITKQRCHLLTTYSHVLVISCSVKMLFIVASSLMHSLTTPDNDFLSPVAMLTLVSATVELILVMCVCQFATLVKRGDAARQEIQSIHSYHLERRSRSRSQSRMRSFHAPSPYTSIGPVPSRSGSWYDVSPAESVCYYVPPPIYLKLDQ